MLTPSLTRLDPFAVFDDMMRSVRSPLAESVHRNSGFVPAVDAHRDGDDLLLRVDLPGIDPENDVAVELSGRALTISGERKSKTEAEGLREVRYGSFSRTVNLPADVGEDHVSADYENGVLQVRVAGVYAEEKPQRIKITSGGESRAVTGEKENEQKELNA